MRRKKKIDFANNPIQPNLLASTRTSFTHANNSSMRACNRFASRGARTFMSLSKYTNTSLFARFANFFVLA